MEEFDIHNIKFYNYCPLPIHNLDYDPISKRVAASYSDASVCLFSSEDRFYKERVFPGTLLKSVEALMWLNGRLFVTGLTGFVSELDVLNLLIKTSVPTHCEGGWCMASDGSKSRFAVGTEAGNIVIYSAEDELTLEESLPKLASRILCVSWCRIRGHLLASGGEGQITVWDVRHQRAVRRLRLARSNCARGIPVVWSLVFSSCGQLFSADSEGGVVIWDPVNGGQISQFNLHKADVLTLASVNSGEKESVWAAGVDPLLLRLDRLKDGRWVIGRQIREVSHDIRALCSTNDRIVAGGVQSRLMTYGLFTEQSGSDNICSDSWWLPWTPQRPVLTCSDSGLGGLIYNDRLEIFQLEDNSAPSVLGVVKPRDGDSILCAEFSANGHFLVFSDTDSLRMMSVKTTPTCVVTPVVLRNAAGSAALSVSFNENECLAAVTLTGRLSLWWHELIENNSVWTLWWSVIPGVSGLASRPHIVDINDKLVAVGCHDGHVLLYSLTSMTSGVHDDEGEPLSVVPTRANHPQPTALSLHSQLPRVVVAYSDNSLIEWNASNQKPLRWSSRFSKSLPRDWKRMSVVRRIFYKDNLIILFTTNRLISIRSKLTFPRSCDNAFEKQSEEFFYKLSKRQKINENEDLQHAVHFSQKRDCYLDLAQFGKRALVAVNIRYSDYINMLPPPLKRKSFGV